MTKQEINDMITDLMEIRAEITRVNQAVGLTVFNPAATDAVESLLKNLREQAAA